MWFYVLTNRKKKRQRTSWRKRIEGAMVKRENRKEWWLKCWIEAGEIRSHLVDSGLGNLECEIYPCTKFKLHHTDKMKSSSHNLGFCLKEHQALHNISGLLNEKMFLVQPNLLQIQAPNKEKNLRNFVSWSILRKLNEDLRIDGSEKLVSIRKKINRLSYTVSTRNIENKFTISKSAWGDNTSFWENIIGCIN